MQPADRDIRQCDWPSRAPVGTASIESSNTLRSCWSRPASSTRCSTPNTMSKRSRDHCPGRSGCGDHCHQHGRSWYDLLGGNWKVTWPWKAPLTNRWRRSRPMAETSPAGHRSGWFLHVIACERHESRRIDNQLRGRSGSSRFLSCRWKPDAVLIRLKNFMEGAGTTGSRASHGQQCRSRGAAQGRNTQLRYPQAIAGTSYHVANEQRKVIITCQQPAAGG